MRRADRLFRIVQILRRGRVTTAHRLAEELEVSERTVYRDAEGRTSARVIRPLGLFFWGAVATLGAWCELRSDFRNFGVDRIEALDLRPEAFEPEPGRGLHDYYRTMAERYQREGDP
jgi:predicted DNA-binding transcriptional regulator YafY